MIKKWLKNMIKLILWIKKIKERRDDDNTEEKNKEKKIGKGKNKKMKKRQNKKGKWENQISQTVIRWNQKIKWKVSKTQLFLLYLNSYR